MVKEMKLVLTDEEMALISDAFFYYINDGRGGGTLENHAAVDKLLGKFFPE
jgi:hypothetical protein